MDRVLMLFFLIYIILIKALLTVSQLTSPTSISSLSSGHTNLIFLSYCSYPMERRHSQQKVWPHLIKVLGRLLSVYSLWHLVQTISKSISNGVSVIIKLLISNSNNKTNPYVCIQHIILFIMKKIITNSVIYISKQLSSIDLTQEKFFPFIHSPIIHAQAINQFAVTGIHAICNFTNIRNTVPYKEDFQDFVFFGRSNVGKSTLVNKLIRREFVQVSKKPGKTKELAFLKIKSSLPTLLVDAPGYGYASDASKHEIMQWGKLIQYYLKHTPKGNNQVILLLIDIMHGFKETDGMLIKLLNQMQKTFMIVFTKCDRANSKEVNDAIEICKELQAKFNSMAPHVHFTSSREDQGINQLRNHLLYRMGIRQLNSDPQARKK